MDYKKILMDIVSAIVEDKNSISVEQTEADDVITLVLKVAENDTGRVIGHHGKIAKAIRTIMKSAGTCENKHIVVEIE